METKKYQPTEIEMPPEQIQKLIQGLITREPELSEVIDRYTKYGNPPKKVLEFAEAQFEIFDILIKHPDLNELFEKLKKNMTNPLYNLTKLREAINAKQYSSDQLETSIIKQLGSEIPPEDLLTISKQYVLKLYKEYLNRIGRVHCSEFSRKLVEEIGNKAKIIELANEDKSKTHHLVVEFKSDNNNIYIIDITFEQFIEGRTGPKVMKESDYLQLISAFGYKKITNYS